MASDLVSNCKDFPLVTIAVPTFNRAPLLRECVTSALAQTYGNFEVLVSDNASTDETRDVLSQFTDGRLRVLRQKNNIGLLPNWNACLAGAKGDYIIFLADDDRISPWLLQRCVEIIRREPQVPIVVTLSNIYSGSIGKTFAARVSRSLETGIRDGSAILTEFLTDQITVTMCGVMMRTALLRDRGGLPLDFPHTADVAAWAPLLLLGNAGFVNEACATFAYHNQSETARLSVEQILRDGWKMANLISYHASENVRDSQRRRALQVQSRRCFARRGLTALSHYRKSGGGIQTMLNFIWLFRGHLSNANTAAVLQFIAIVLCPHWIAERIRQLRPTVPERPASRFIAGR
jgi:glycosyltransferase involved in cell wall biosynthesis